MTMPGGYGFNEKAFLNKNTGAFYRPPIQNGAIVPGMVPGSSAGAGNLNLSLMANKAQYDPLWMQGLMASNSGGAMTLAQKILGGGSGGGFGAGQEISNDVGLGGPGTGGGTADFGNFVSQLLGGVDTANPGMNDDQFKQMLNSISQQGQREKAGIAKSLSAGGSVDPEAMASMFAKTSEGRMSAMGGAHATRAGLNQQALQGLLRNLSPFYKTQQMGVQAFQDDLSSLYGNLLSSGLYTAKI